MAAVNDAASRESKCDVATSEVFRFLKILKETGLTDQYDVATCKIIRMTEKDEFLHISNGIQVDKLTGLERVRVKALYDGTEGWISIRGNGDDTRNDGIANPSFITTCRWSDNHGCPNPQWKSSRCT